MSKFDTFKEDFILFTESGFIAVNQADEESARRLFEAAELLDPKHPLPQVGFGYLHLHKLELKESIKAFEKALDLEPDNEMVKTFLGIAMSMLPNGTTKGEKILHQTAKSKDSSIKKLSDTAIDFVERFIKKSPGPAGKGRL